VGPGADASELGCIADGRLAPRAREFVDRRVARRRQRRMGRDLRLLRQLSRKLLPPGEQRIRANQKPQHLKRKQPNRKPRIPKQQLRKHLQKNPVMARRKSLQLSQMAKNQTASP